MKCPMCGVQFAGRACPGCGFAEEYEEMKMEGGRFTDAARSFLTEVTGSGEIVIAPAPVIVDQRFAVMLRADSVLVLKVGKRLDDPALSAFERHIAQFLNGSRPVARVQVKSGLAEDDVRIALGLMLEKDFLEQAGVARKRRSKQPSTPSAPTTSNTPSTPKSDGPAAASAGAASGDPTRRLRARKFYETALQDLEGRSTRGRGFMFAKMAAAQDPAEPLYAALVQKWAHLDVAPSPPSTTSDPEWVRMMGQAQEAEDAGDHARAIQILEAAVQRAPRQAAIHNKLGILLAARQKDFQRALEHLRCAVDLAPGKVAYENNLKKVLTLQAGEGMGGDDKMVSARFFKKRY